MNVALDWNSIYLTCFGIGFVLTLIAFVTGVGHFHVGHFHFGHGHLGAKTGFAKGHMISPFNGFTLVAFLCWFGGTGYLLHRYSPFLAPVVLGFSLVSGLAGAGLVFWFLTRVLMPMERALEPADTDVIGVVGKLSGGIPQKGFGEILFSQNGSRRSMAVRSDDGSEIERGEEVIVMRHQRGVAYVRRWSEFEHGLIGEQPSRIEGATTKD
jgi:hypothetical protein